VFAGKHGFLQQVSEPLMSMMRSSTSDVIDGEAVEVEAPTLEQGDG
jgi:hypothetical protein